MKLQIIFLLCVPILVETLSKTEMNEIHAGLEFGKDITQAMKPATFVSFLGGATSGALSLISGTISFVELIFSFLGTNESKELLEIKRLYNEMNRRFDIIDLEFQNLKKLINWSQLKIQYSTIEQNIITDADLFRHIYEGPLAIKASGKDYFMHSFENNCLNCAENLYLGLMGKGLTLNADIFNVTMVSLEFDRPKTQNFMLGLLKLFVQGINNELAYRKFKYETADFMYHKMQWAHRLQNVTAKMLSIDNMIRNKYHDQAEKDIKHISQQYPRSSLSNDKFSAKLYNFLVQKYDWKDWLVIVYRPTSGTNNHINHVCDGYRKYGMYGRDVAIASVDETKQPINTTEANIIIHQITTIKASSCFTCIHFGQYCTEYGYISCTRKLNAEGVYNTIPQETRNCNVYGSVGVIDSWVDLWYQGLPKRLVHMRTPGSNSYSIHLFG